MSQSQSSLFYELALSQVKGVGGSAMRQLISYGGSAEAVFKLPTSKLLKIPDIGTVTVSSIKKFDGFKAVERELKFLEREKIQALFFTNPLYPKRLLHCNDAPALLFYKGKCNMNASRMLAVVGTRNASDYGKEQTKNILQQLNDVVIISGLAFGIDAVAHQTALDYNFSTIGVMAHGMNRIYPFQHKKMAERMLENGGLLTEYTSFDEFTPHNFPSRNRIVAGMCDAILVTETAVKGGAMITCNIASSYNRDVFALPGKNTDKNSSGCNLLIKQNKAALIESAADIIEAMNWIDETKKATVKKQMTLALDLTDEEKNLLQYIPDDKDVDVDLLKFKSGFSPSKLANLLLQMEICGYIAALPGKRFKRLI